MPQWHKALTA